MSYIQLTTPLVLHADPVLPGHAVTKRYVDGKKAFLQASWFTSGVVSALRMPALSGDISSSAGSGTVSLLVNGVVAGSYTKVTVDSTGRVTTGGQLTASDIPSLDWGKVTTGKPTTAAGYGINNLIALSGGTVSGHIASSAESSDDLHAVTKAYVDDNVTSVVSASLLPGDVVRKATDVTPSGFLRCNGASISKTTYAALFGSVMTSDSQSVTLDYNSYAAIGNGKPWKQQYDINETQSQDIAGWTAGTALPVSIFGSQTLVTKNRVYLIGGYVNNTISSDVYTAPIKSDGSLGVWLKSVSLPGVNAESQVIVTKNRVYLLGGYNGSIALATVYTAAINFDGTLGVWTTATSLPASVYQSQAVVTKNRVYLFGGNGSSVVYTAPVNADGTLGTWSTSTALPATLAYSQVIATKNTIYLLGGRNNNTSSNVVYKAPINLDGTLGGWTTDASLPGVVYNAQALVTKNRAYLFGGNGSSVVYTAAVNTDGTLGTWSTATALPTTIGQSQLILTKTKVFILGGWINNTASSSVYTASTVGGLNDYSGLYDGSVNKFDSNNVTGTLVLVGDSSENYLTPGAGRPWEQQYLLGTAQSGNITGTVNSTGFPVAVSGAQALVTKNRVYVMGGRDSSDAHTDTIYQATVNADGSLGGWKDSATYVNSSVSGNGSITILGGAKRIAVTASGSNGYSYGGERLTAATPGTPQIGHPSFPNGLPPYVPGKFQGYADYPAGLPPYQPATPPVPATYAPVVHVPGTASTFTVAGTTLTFPGDAGTSTKYVELSSQTALTATYSIATGSATIKYTDHATSLANGTVLPAKLTNHNAVVTKNRVYLIGGNQDSTIESSVYTTTINLDGSLSGWTKAATLPGNVNREDSSMVITRDMIHVIGGRSVDTKTPSSTIYSAPIDANGLIGAWTTSTSLPASFYAGAIFTTYNRVYLMGGYVSGSPSTTVYTAPINPDGSLGTWGMSAPLPTHAAYGKVYVSKDTVYVFGANNAATMYYASIYQDGTLGPWTTGTSTGYNPVNAAIFSTNGKLYLVGGGTGLTPSTNVATYTIGNSINDYSPYYDGTILPVSPSSFRLPDYTAKEANGINFYIKY